MTKRRFIVERHLIVGLGNPEPRYTKNRHNVGFMVLDQLADEARINVTRSKFKGLYGTGEFGGKSVVLLKPMTFMNLSGRSVSPAAKFFGVPPERVMVIHDELDLPYGTLRLKSGGGHAGHNGLRSMVAELGDKGFQRLRVGIGRPVHGTVSNYVLSDFSAGEERDWLPDLVERAANALETALRLGMKAAMNEVHAKK